jgi:hypothetical protein
METMHNSEQKDELIPSAHHHAKPMLSDGLIVGEIIIADIIGNGFYEIHSFGETYVSVKLLKLFGKGWLWRGHVTNCHNYPHPINLEKWMSYRRVQKPFR